MRTYEHTIEIGRSLDECVTVIHNGDEHIGSPESDEGLQERVVKRILDDDKCYWVTTGDNCEFIQRNDPRFEDGMVPSWFTFEMLPDPVRHQIARYGEIYSPIKEKCLANVIGNHEFAIMKHNIRDVYTDIGDALSLPEERRLGTHGFLRLRFISYGKVFWRVVIYMHHATTAGRTKSAIVNQLERLPQGFHADVYCVGHAHKKVAFDDEYAAMDPSTGRAVLRKRYYSATGSYVRGVSDRRNGTYAERALLYPQGLGPVELKFYPNRKEIRMII